MLVEMSLPEVKEFATWLRERSSTCLHLALRMDQAQPIASPPTPAPLPVIVPKRRGRPPGRATLIRKLEADLDDCVTRAEERRPGPVRDQLERSAERIRKQIAELERQAA